MRTAKLFVAAIVAFASLPLMAQQAGATAQQSTSAGVSDVRAGNSDSDRTTLSGQPGQAGAQTAGSSTVATAGWAKGVGAVNESANGSAAAGEEMRPVNGELQGKLDTKSSKVGDQVVVKTTESTRTADGTVVPKGTRLVGHVTSVQAHGKSSADSQLGIEFDRAELKNGQSLPIHSEIRSVAPPASALAASSMAGDDAFGGGTMSGGGRAMGSARMGGGFAGGSVREVAATSSRLGSGAGSMAKQSAHETGHVTGNAAAEAAGKGAHANAGAGGASTVHATGIPGVNLTGRGSGSGSASGTLSASRQNIHLDSGTQMELGVSKAK